MVKPVPAVPNAAPGKFRVAGLEEEMRAVNITPELVRFSSGLGDLAPVLEDLSTALKNL